MRTVEEQNARYNWLTPEQFAAEFGLTGEYVRSLIRDGELGEKGEIMDVGRGGRHRYRIHPRALARFRQLAIERAMAGRDDAE